MSPIGQLGPAFYPGLEGSKDTLDSIETILGSSIKESTDHEIYNVTMTLANTEYSQVLPANTKKFMIHTRDGTEFRLAFETGRVAVPTEPYFTVPDFEAYWEDLINPAALTLYFGCADTLKVIEIICWS